MTKKPKQIPADEWKWFGLAAHFICGRWCRFHMATQVGDYLISTVGEYIPNHKTGGTERGEIEFLKANPYGEEIGYQRTFETMVFKAGEPCTCGCGVPTTDGSEVDFAGYNDRGSATEGHMEMCRKYARL